MRCEDLLTASTAIRPVTDREQRPVSRVPELTLERLDAEQCDWAEIDAFADRQVFQTREWLAFLAATQGAEPVVSAVRRAGEVVGYFTGAIVRRYAVRILGSPFPGWTTAYMGFNLQEGVSRSDCAAALLHHAFGALRCVHVELRDRELRRDEAARLDVSLESFGTFEIDLRASEDELFKQMTSACRRCIRKAEREGVLIEEAGDLAFADEYYAQLEDVFAKQGLRPPYEVERVRSLVANLHASGRLLLLRARSPAGKGIATGIFPALGRTMYFWGGASWRSDQILRPNEAIFWYAMRHWKARGVEVFDMGGGGEYKRKYGASEVVVPHLVASRFAGIGALRAAAQHVYSVQGLRRLLERPSRAHEAS
jgi:CelD/BcsL family acetyltransferase involved in cellulose biosynthesis